MKIPGFDILDKIGEDRTTTIWKASQTSLNRTVAIKILRPEIAADPEESKSFIEEGRHIAKLKHPNILSVYDVLCQNNLFFFVMEHADGVSVAQMLQKSGKIPVRKALEIVKDTAQALNHAWIESHIVHRNIKPENILIDEDGEVKVSFIGLAKMVDPMGKGAGQDARTIIGTPHYMSPEQAMCSPNLDCRTDMYGLGATLYHMLTGKMPFEEFEPMVAARKHISDFIHHPRDIDPTISPGTSQLITQLMMKERKDRCNNWSEVLQDVRKLLAGQVIIKRSNPNAVSTVEAEAKVILASTAPVAQVIKKGPDLPLGIQIPAWACLLAWWYFLARVMLQFWKS